MSSGSLRLVKNKTKSIVPAMWLAGSPQWRRENKFGHVGWIRHQGGTGGLQVGPFLGDFSSLVCPMQEGQIQPGV